MAKFGIFCVDDDSIINAVTKFQISSVIDDQLHVVECFDSPVEALAEIEFMAKQDVEVSVCVVDFRMPEMRGDEFVRKIKASYPACRCIILSGNSSATLVSDLVEDNLIEFYINKPWENDELLRKIDHCLPLKAKLF